MQSVQNTNPSSQGCDAVDVRAFVVSGRNSHESELNLFYLDQKQLVAVRERSLELHSLRVQRLFLVNEKAAFCGFEWVTRSLYRIQI